MDEELRQILQIFLEESSENLDVLEQGLLRLEQGPAAGEELNVIFRAAHSIKGGAATFGLDPVAEFTHVMETLLDQLRSGRRQADAAVVRVLLQAVDALRALLAGAVEDDVTAAPGPDSESTVVSRSRHERAARGISRVSSLTLA